MYHSIEINCIEGKSSVIWRKWPSGLSCRQWIGGHPVQILLEAGPGLVTQCYCEVPGELQVKLLKCTHQNLGSEVVSWIMSKFSCGAGK